MADADVIPQAVQGGISLYQAGGFALLLLAIGVVGISFMAWFFMRTIHRLEKRVTELEDRQFNRLTKCIDANTVSNEEVSSSSQEVRTVLGVLTDVLRERLPETRGHFKTPLPERPR